MPLKWNCCVESFLISIILFQYKILHIELVCSKLSGVALNGGRWLIKMVDPTNLAKVFHIFRFEIEIQQELNAFPYFQTVTTKMLHDKFDKIADIGDLIDYFRFSCFNCSSFFFEWFFAFSLDASTIGIGQGFTKKFNILSSQFGI